MVDSADKERLEESMAVFQSTLTHEFVKGKSILILANKQDKEAPLPSDELAKMFKLDGISMSPLTCSPLVIETRIIECFYC